MRVFFASLRWDRGCADTAYAVFARSPALAPPDGKRLAVGVAFCAPMLPEQIGRKAHIDVVAAAVQAAIAEAGVDDPDINAQRHIRGAVGGLVAAVTGDTRHFVSDGTAHQGPHGSGLIAAIAQAYGSEAGSRRPSK